MLFTFIWNFKSVTAVLWIWDDFILYVALIHYQAELTDVKEVFKMTRLGQMLVNDGIEEGIKKGIRILSMLKKGKSIADIAADTGISEVEIRKIQRSMEENK